MMIFAWVRYFPSKADLEQQVAANFPVDAVRYLRQHPLSGPMLNSYGYGGYLIWAGEPADGVFIDGRGDLYEHEGVFGDFRQIVSLAPGTRQLLGRYNVRSCLLQRGTPLATFLGADPRWTQVYHDEVSELYVRHAGSDEAVRGHATLQASSVRQD